MNTGHRLFVALLATGPAGVAMADDVQVQRRNRHDNLWDQPSTARPQPQWRKIDRNLSAPVEIAVPRGGGLGSLLSAGATAAARLDC
jgi:hypothetical protein